MVILIQNSNASGFLHTVFEILLFRRHLADVTKLVYKNVIDDKKMNL